MWRLFILTLFLLNGTSCVERASYENYHVYQIQPENENELNIIKAFEAYGSDVLFLDGVPSVGVRLNALVAPERIASFERKLQTLQMEYKLLDTNAQATLDAGDVMELVADSNRRAGEYMWTEYHELNDTYHWMQTLTKKYPDTASLFNIGTTYEGRDILGLKISKGPNKPIVFLEAGMHAREWISPAATTYMADKLLSSTKKNIQTLTEQFDWYIVPHANPDGYVYTHSKNRLWRKTRKPAGQGADCVGTDPNRNFDFHWNEVGASDKQCSETYAGPTAFSEPETRALADYLISIQKRLFLYVSLHAYSQLLLYPYGHTAELPPNHQDLRRIYNASVAAIRRRYNTRYTGGNIYDAIYPATGSSIDWVYGTLNVKYSFCYELRPSSNNFWTGFRLPARQIIPTGEETLDSLIAMVETANAMSRQ